MNLKSTRAGLCAKTLAALGALGLAPLAFAQDAMAPVTTATAPAINSGDTAWMIMATALVMLMTPGLAFFYAGMVRSKNAVATMMQSFIALGVVSLLWWAVGYSMAFATGGAFLGGFDWMFFQGVAGTPNADYAGTIPHLLFAVYQMMFAIITPALIAGAFAERMKFGTYVVFIALWSLCIYAPVAHWVWGTGGFLRTMGLLDFAGGTVVHQTAGFSALAAAFVFGKRTDYGRANYAAHSVPLIAIGTALLWFGWFGFNAGSALASGELSTFAFASTHFGALAGGLVWGMLDMFLKGKFNLVGFCIGLVVGLVSVTPAAGFVTVSSAIIIGVCGGAAANLFAYWRGKSQIDDSLDVFACHGVGGMVGTLLTGVFASKLVNPAGADGGFAQFFIQLKGSLMVAVFAFIGSFVLLKVLNMVMGLRPTTEQETRGLDPVEHGESAYT